MLSDELENEILRNIALSGSADINKAIVKPSIADKKNLHILLDKSSGKPRLYSHRGKQFSLILSQPLTLQVLNPFEIRCCLCRSVISYPCWYYSIKYAVNHFHYFICFDKTSPDKPSTKCYRKDV